MERIEAFFEKFGALCVTFDFFLHFLRFLLLTSSQETFELQVSHLLIHLIICNLLDKFGK